MSSIFSRITAILLIIHLAANAQDVMRTKKDTIDCWITEIGSVEIKYFDKRLPQGPLIVIPKVDVLEIIYESGEHLNLKADSNIVQLSSHKIFKIQAIKVELLSLFANNFAFVYERNLKYGLNLEGKFAFIFPGPSEDVDEASGYYITAGIKYLLHPGSLDKGIKSLQPLYGSYVKPEIIFNTYTSDLNIINNQTQSLREVRFYNYALNLVWGKQFIVGNKITFDFYFGMGYGFQKTVYEKKDGDQYGLIESGEVFSHYYVDDPEWPLIVSFGVNMGVIF